MHKSRQESSAFSQTSSHDCSIEAADKSRSLSSVVEDVVNHLFIEMQTLGEIQSQIKSAINRLEAKLDSVQLPTLAPSTKDWYTPKEAAKLLGKGVYTVQEWCRLQRINARKRQCGRGETDEWEISSQEIERYRNHGLLPIPLKY
jgi:Helix-turn-helix domain